MLKNGPNKDTHPYLYDISQRKSNTGPEFQLSESPSPKYTKLVLSNKCKNFKMRKWMQAKLKIKNTEIKKNYLNRQ